MSTFFNQKYQITKFMSAVELVEQNVTIQTLDRLDQKIYRTINSLKPSTFHVWTDIDKIENVSWFYYGTTTLWWIIMIYNGFVHPLEIEPTTVISIPDISSIDIAIRNKRTNTTTKMVI